MNQATLASYLASLPSPRGRIYEAANGAAACGLIGTWLENEGWHVRFEEFEAAHGFSAGRPVSPLWVAKRGVNIVATCQPNAPISGILVMAHYDTVMGTPGAVDNGASVVALAALARRLSQDRCQKAVIVATDLEEVGLLGARVLAKKYGKQVEMAINLDTFSYTDCRKGSQFWPDDLDLNGERLGDLISDHGSRGDFRLLIHDHAATHAAIYIRDRIRYHLGTHAAFTLEAPATVVGDIANHRGHYLARGDHVCFWEEGTPSIHITDTAELRNPNYHRSTDTPEKVDFAVLAAVIESTADYIVRREWGVQP